MKPSSEVLLVLALILANGVFAMAEIAIISARKARLEQQAGRGNRGAGTALALSTDRRITFCPPCRWASP